MSTQPPIQPPVQPGTPSAGAPAGAVPGAGAPKRKRRWPWIVLAAAVVLVGLGAFGAWWFLKDDAPSAVSLDAALEDAAAVTSAAPATTAGGGTATTAAGSVATTAAPGSDTGAIAGTWSIDPSLGEFSFDDASGSFAGFRIKEELQGIGSTTAVGRTPAVTGTMAIDGTTLTATEITADLSQLVTNDSRRDSRARSALDVDQFPNATFVLTQPVDLGDAATTGGPVKVTATGDLTIHGQTKTVQVEIEAQRSGDVIAVVGSVPVVFSDYGVTTPSAPIVVSVDDNGTVEFQLLFTQS